jgi:hypothetical protein
MTELTQEQQIAELKAENESLKSQRRDWLDTDLQAKALVEQERELIAARAELNGIKQNIAFMASCNLVARMERAESERDSLAEQVKVLREALKKVHTWNPCANFNERKIDRIVCAALATGGK